MVMSKGLRSGLLSCAATLVAGAFLLAGPAPSARADEHKDAKLGYSVNYPHKWLKRPVASDERWVVAKFECDREFESADKEGYYTRHRPWIDVVVIPLALETRKGGTIEKKDDGTLTFREAAPWKNLKEYLEQTLQQGEGGFFFSNEVETTVGGMKCIQYEVTFEKLIDHPKRVHAWAFYTSDAIYGVVGETLIRFEDKVKPDLLSAFKSLKTFARTGALAGGEQTGKDIVIDDKDEDSTLSNEDRAKKRDRKATERVARIKEQVGNEWTVRESAHFIAVSHADAKFTKATLDHCEALRGWLDDNLGYMGTGYPGKIVIRICADSDEHSAFTKTGGWSGDRIEVTTYRDRDGWSDWNMQSLSTGVLEIWMRDKNESVTWAFPMWIRTGLREMIGTAVSKGSKIEFKPSTWDRQEMAIAKRDGKLPPARSFFTMTTEELYASGSFDIGRHAGIFVRFLVIGGARKNAKYKGVFEEYVKAVVIAVDEREAKEAKERRAAAEPTDADEPKSEEEEDKKIKEREQEWAKSEKTFLDGLATRVFGTWTQKDWDAFTAAYWKEIE